MGDLMVKVRVPATSANMGAGFDCFGLALGLYNILSVEESDKFSITIKDESLGIPTTKDNKIYQAIQHFYKEIGKPIPYLKIHQEDNIPLARGLGSSAACIVAGLAAANKLSREGLTDEQLVYMAHKIEGHPDNIAPAYYGGMVVSVADGSKIHHVKIGHETLSELSFVTFIPKFTLSTTEARGVLPQTYSREDAVFNISRASLLIASIMSKKWDNLPIAIDDRLHQPYRNRLITNVDSIYAMAKSFGAKGVYLSGAGPTVVAIFTNPIGQNLLTDVKLQLATLPNTSGCDWAAHLLQPDFKGVQVESL